MSQQFRTWGHRAPLHAPSLARYKALAAAMPHVPLPPSKDLRPQFAFLPITDQERLNACTAHAITANVSFLLHQQEQKVALLSQLFVYFNERVIGNETNKNAPVEMSWGLESVQKEGACTSDLWPWNQSKFADRPPEPAYTEAKQRRIVTFVPLPQQETDLKRSLAGGKPFVFGFKVYPSFTGDNIEKTGKMEMPEDFDMPLGGHAVVAVGYDDAEKRVICRNSFGPNWGMAGYFTMPYEFIFNPNYAHDFWDITSVTG